jgi:hypothetical protein
MIDPGPGLVGRKFPPCACSVKLPIPPAYALPGNRFTITEILAIVTAELPVRDVSAELVATTLIAFGEGVEVGALNTPSDVIVPHGEPGPLHAAPVTFHVTF